MIGIPYRSLLWRAGFSSFVLALLFAVPQDLSAQSSTVSAAPSVSQSSGRPSTIAIRQNILRQKQALLERQVNDARRCISDASKPQVFRDPQGNINLVPQIDVVDCTRRLRTLSRQLAELQKEFQVLARDASFQGQVLRSRAQQAATSARIFGRDSDNQ